LSKNFVCYKVIKLCEHPEVIYFLPGVVLFLLTNSNLEIVKLRSHFVYINAHDMSLSKLKKGRGGKTSVLCVTWPIFFFFFTMCDS